MRKAARGSLLGLLFTALSATALLAQIRVTSPGAGEQWLYRSNHTVTWTSGAGVGPTVRIELYREGESRPQINLALTTENDLSFAWTVPDFVAPSNYHVRVTSLDGRVYGNSGVFTIRFPRPAVTVTYPNGGETLTIGSILAIRWTPVELPANAKVDVVLLRNGAEAATLVTGYPAAGGNTPWHAGAGVGNTPGDHYKVRVRVQGTDATDDSDRGFSLAASTAAGDIELVRLSGQEGHLFIHVRSTFPRLMAYLTYEVERPSWAPRRVERRGLSVAFEGPGERDYSLERVLPTDLTGGGDIIHSQYQVTLDPDNALAETNENNNRKTKSLCGYPVFPVIEGVYFGTQEAHRNQTLAVTNGRVNGIYESAADKRRNHMTPWEVYLPVTVVIRNYGWRNCEGRIQITQIGVQRFRPQEGSGGGRPNEYQERAFYPDRAGLPSGADEVTVHRLMSSEKNFNLDPTEILVEYLWEGDGARTHMAKFRFPVTFQTLIDRFNQSH